MEVMIIGRLCEDAQATRQVSVGKQSRLRLDLQSRQVRAFAMSATDEWSDILRDHPIFSLPKPFDGPLSNFRDLLELSTTTLSKFTTVDPQDDELTPSGRRQVMILKDADLIIAAGKEVRISSVGDLKLSQSVRKSYKVSIYCL
jgi:hypothetical protein